MLRFLLSVAAIFPLVFANLIFPAGVSARRCPVKMPETLLALYQNSDSIHIATFARIEHGDTIEENENYTSVGIKKHFTVSSTLKGETEKFVVLSDNEYRYKNTAEPLEIEIAQPESADDSEAVESEEAVAAEGSEEPEEDMESEASLEPGDDLLLFLKKGDDEPELTDYIDGTKKLSREHIGIYETRIRELNAIFDAKEVNRSSLINWLIRCAEDPVTRWEATYELLASVENLESQNEAVEEEKARVARGEEPDDAGKEPTEVSETVAEEKNEEVEEEEAEGQSRIFQTGSTVFAEMLDVNHKQFLSDLLLNRPVARGEKYKPVKGDRELLELVRRWGDARLPAYLIGHLQTGIDAAGSNLQTMEALAAVLDDKRLTALVGEYQEIAWENGTDEVVENSAGDEDENETTVEENPPPAEAAVTAETETVIAIEYLPVVIEQSEPAADSDTAPADTVAEDEKPPKITYGELRETILAKFLKRAESIIAKREAESN